MTVERTVRLHFGDVSRAADTHVNLSAVRTDGRVLWLAGDETATIERLVADDEGEPGEYGDQLTFHLADLVELPGPADEEADIEGIARSGPFLWAVGSHSLKRKKVKPKHDDVKALKRLAQVSGEANRQILVRIPVRDVDGLPCLVPQAVASTEPVRAAVFGVEGDDLRDLLGDDDHLAPFLPIPGKDNGLDIEGIAVREDRVYLGLRGPVLRGWAFVLELRPHADPDEPGRLRLGEFPDGKPYRKHALDLGGLGVRDLCPDGDDILVLAGPSMDLDGPVRVYRWQDACRSDSPDVVRGDELSRELDLAYGEGCDHAEGIGLIGPPKDGRLLVVYDSPSPERLLDGGVVVADVVRLPPSSGS